MTAKKQYVSRSRTRRLRKLAGWAEKSIESSSDLVGLGDSEFRRRWSRYGAENTLAVTELWEEAWQKQAQARQDVERAAEELRRVQELTPDQESAASDEPSAFPALREQLSEAQARLDSASKQRRKAAAQRDEALSDGRVRRAELRALCDERREELEALRQTLATERSELKGLETQIEEQTEVRDRLQRLVTAVNEQFRR